MRRKERQINNQTEINEILENNNICRIALLDNNVPYIVPMNYGYSNNKIYLHTANAGKKINIIKKNNQVCFEITDSIEIIRSEKACDFGTKFRSVIGYGKIKFIKEENEKQKALQIIMKQQTKKIDWQFSENIILTRATIRQVYHLSFSSWY